MTSLQTMGQSTLPDTVCVGEWREYWVLKVPSSTYTWYIDGNIQEERSHLISIQWNIPGTYAIAVQETSVAGCTGVLRSSPIVVYPSPVVTLSPESEMCAIFPYQLDAGSGFTSYLWSNGSMLQSTTAWDEGEYTVKVTNAYGCISYAGVRLINCLPPIIQPTAFTPDGDGLNDVFKPILLYQQGYPATYHLKIFNKRGQLLFETNDPLCGWDGYFEGNLSPIGMYFYQISITVNGQTKKSQVTGSIMLVK